jgi:uncharacterized protein (TIGR01777 family)
MTILITGGTGFLGKALVKRLYDEGYKVRVLSRNPKKYERSLGKFCELVYWDAKGIPDEQVFKQVQGIINLMGDSVASGRWTKKRKRVLVESRINTTRFLVNGAKLYANELRLFISGSAVGYYDQSKKVVDEQDLAGSSFLSDLCLKWEAEAIRINEMDKVRECRIRTGLVLGKGGALEKMLPAFSRGLGGKLGSGKQWMNWIHVSDWVAMLVFLIEHKQCEGAYNAVSPNNTRQETFAKILGNVLGASTFFSVPAFLLKIILGEMSQILLEGCQCSSRKIANEGFVFKYDKLEPALRECLR